MPSDWMVYEQLKEHRKCSVCGQQMELVKSVGPIRMFTSEDKEVFRCKNCGNEVEKRPFFSSLPDAIKWTWKIIKFTDKL